MKNRPKFRTVLRQSAEKKPVSSMCTVTLFLMLPKCNDMTKTFHRSSVYWFISGNGPLYVCVTLRGHAYIWTHNNPYATWRRYFQLRQPLPTESTTGVSSSLHEPYVLNHLSQCLLFPFSVCFTVIRGGKKHKCKYYWSLSLVKLAFHGLL